MYFNNDEYKYIYAYVMRNNKENLMNKDDIIDYLVTQCYIIEQHNDLLTDILNKIKSALKPVGETFEEDNFHIDPDDLPF